MRREPNYDALAGTTSHVPGDAFVDGVEEGVPKSFELGTPMESEPVPLAELGGCDCKYGRTVIISEAEEADEPEKPEGMSDEQWEGEQRRQERKRRAVMLETDRRNDAESKTPEWKKRIRGKTGGDKQKEFDEWRKSGGKKGKQPSKDELAGKNESYEDDEEDATYIVGNDYLGQTITEKLSEGETKHAFMTVVRVSKGGRPAQNAKAQWGNSLGLPYLATDVIAAQEDYQPVDNPDFTEPDYSDPQTSESGDPRGLYKPSKMGVPVSVTLVPGIPLYGMEQGTGEARGPERKSIPK